MFRAVLGAARSAPQRHVAHAPGLFWVSGAGLTVESHPVHCGDPAANVAYGLATVQ
jgi:hypothetical protein